MESETPRGFSAEPGGDASARERGESAPKVQLEQLVTRAPQARGGPAACGTSHYCFLHFQNLGAPPGPVPQFPQLDTRGVRAAAGASQGGRAQKVLRLCARGGQHQLPAAAFPGCGAGPLCDAPDTHKPAGFHTGLLDRLMKTSRETKNAKLNSRPGHLVVPWPHDKLSTRAGLRLGTEAQGASPAPGPVGALCPRGSLRGARLRPKGT